jgi:murein DD-endopeptidase MepM/ murein hydrolase activator NlpD
VVVTERSDIAYTKLANGFDFPVGKPDAEGYYKARGYQPNGHQGEDWDGTRGGDSDLGDPIYSIGDGVVVLSRDVHLGWGNVVIARYAYRENGQIHTIDALYGHLDSMVVRAGERIARGQKIGTMGTAHGIYDAHLHFEIRKNLEIGMSRAAFPRDFSNYYDPTQFIRSHRHIDGGGANYPVAINTFKRDSATNFEVARNYSGYRGATTRESSSATKRAISFERVTPLDD